LVRLEMSTALSTGNRIKMEDAYLALSYQEYD
jgi:hypothetical protein